jgi:hypothetical protein
VASGRRALRSVKRRQRKDAARAGQRRAGTAPGATPATARAIDGNAKPTARRCWV